MTRDEMLIEIERLKSAEQELWPKIMELRAELTPLEDKRIELASRRLDLERAVVKVKVLPYAGPKRKPSRAKHERRKSEQSDAVKAIMELSSEDREAFIAALEGKLAQANG